MGYRSDVATRSAKPNPRAAAEQAYEVVRGKAPKVEQCPVVTWVYTAGVAQIVKPALVIDLSEDQ